MTSTLPTILVDLDGVVVDFERGFYELCEGRGYVMHGGATHAGARCDQHRFATDCIDDRQHRNTALKAVEAAGWFRWLHPIDGAIEGVNALAEVADVWLCSKPMQASSDCRDAKADWVREHVGRGWDERLILTPNKGMIRGDILLDDAPKSEWFERAEWGPVIYPASFNGVGSPYSIKHGLERAPRWQWGDDPNQLLSLASDWSALREVGMSWEGWLK